MPLCTPTYAMTIARSMEDLQSSRLLAWFLKVPMFISFLPTSMSVATTISLRTGSLATSPFPDGSYFAQLKELIFMTEWYFLPEGVADVCARFQDALAKNSMQAELEWLNSDCVFKVKCLRGDVRYVSPLFHKALQSIIREEEELNGIYEEDRDDCDSESECSFDDDLNTPTEGTGIKSRKIQCLDVWKASAHNQQSPTQHTTDLDDLLTGEIGPEVFCPISIETGESKAPSDLLDCPIKGFTSSAATTQVQAPWDTAVLYEPGWKTMSGIEMHALAENDMLHQPALPTRAARPTPDTNHTKSNIRDLEEFLNPPEQQSLI